MTSHEPPHEQVHDDLLATICHDLRAPLSAIVMGSTFLTRQLGGDATQIQMDPSRRMAEAIRRSAARMDRMIGDYHDLVKLEAGRLPLVLETYDARALLMATQGAVGSDEARIDVAIEDTGTEALHVRADHDRVVQVLTKLARNAADAAPDAPVRMSVTPRADAVLFRVEDAGPGIDADILPHIFDRRWMSARRARKGPGLGLAIAHALVRAMHGELRVERTDARGTSMAFTLPRV